METYIKINWQNKPVETTPINSTNLNHMDDQIYDLTENKADNSAIPTALSSLDNDLNLQSDVEVQNAINSAISSLGTLLVFKGVVDTYNDLLAISSPKNGDVYKVLDDSSALDPHGNNSEYYYHNGWDYYGSDFEVDLNNYYTKSENDALLNNKVSSSTIIALKYDNGFYYSLDNVNWNILKSGDDGATFIPSVDDEGNISWSNNKSYPNPETKNIKGSKGETGYSPDIEVAEDTATTYKLNIYYGEGGKESLTTPNLKGQDGEGSGDMLKSIYDVNEDGIVDYAYALGNGTDNYNYDTLNNVLNNKQNKMISTNISIPVSLWEEDSTYQYKALVNWSGITSAYKVDMLFDYESLNNASDVRNLTESTTDGFYLYADALPSNTLNGTAYALKVV